MNPFNMPNQRTAFGFIGKRHKSQLQVKEQPDDPRSKPNLQNDLHSSVPETMKAATYLDLTIFWGMTSINESSLKSIQIVLDFYRCKKLCSRSEQ